MIKNRLGFLKKRDTPSATAAYQAFDILYGTNVIIICMQFKKEKRITDIQYTKTAKKLTGSVKKLIQKNKKQGMAS